MGELVNKAVLAENITTSLRRDGYSFIPAEFACANASDLGISRQAFLESIRDLPVDPECAVGNRQRRFGLFYLFPWTGQLESLRPTWDADRDAYVIPYRQKPELNSEAQGKVRIFSSLLREQVTNLFLRDLIARCFAVLPWTENGAVIVQVHIIRLAPYGHAPAYGVPNCIHRDGQPYTFGFLLERFQVEGGENIIARLNAVNRLPEEVSQDDIVDRFVLDTVFDGWVIDDERVGHYVTPVSASEDLGMGKRTILLIDFSRAIPEEI